MLAILNKNMFIGAALLLITACGAAEDNRGPRAVQTDDLNAALYCGKTDTAAAGLGLEDAAMRRVPADQLRVLDGATQTTMCDVMRKAGKKLALFTFVSTKCYPCMKWAEMVSASLTEKKLNGDVMSVVVMTDSIQDLSVEDAKRLKADVAKKSTWIHDYYGDMWSFFGLDTWVPGTEPTIKPLTIVMDADARGFFTEDTTNDAAAIVAQANAVMTLDIQAAP